MSAYLRRWVLPYAAAVTVIVLALLLWQWYAAARRIFFLPTPTAVGASLETEWFSGAATTWFLSEPGLAAIGQTFASALAGWGIAGMLGVVAGSILGRWKSLADLADLPLLLLRSVPPVAVIPICIVIFGLGGQMKLVVVTFGCIWPVLINTLQGVRDIHPVHLDVARLNHLEPIAAFGRVIVPAASPKIFAGLRVSMSIAIVVTVGAEMFAGTGGLGGMVLAASSTYDVPALWAALLVVAMCGLVPTGALLLMERAALRWHTTRRLQ